MATNTKARNGQKHHTTTVGAMRGAGAGMHKDNPKGGGPVSIISTTEKATKSKKKKT